MCAQLGDGLEKEVRDKLFTEYYYNAEAEDGSKIRVRNVLFCFVLFHPLLLLTDVDVFLLSNADESYRR